MSNSRWSRLIPTRRRVVVYLAVILALLLVRLVLDLWAGYRLESVAARLSPIYHGLDMASLAPPPVPKAENRARVLGAAVALCVGGDDAAQAGLLSKALTEGRATQDTVKREEALRRAVSSNRAALQVLDEAESRPKSNWEITYRDGVRMRLPSLMDVRNLSRVNHAAGLLELESGRADEAARRARLGFVLADSLAQEPNLLVQLIRIGIATEHVRLLKAVLAQGEPTMASLQALAAALERGGADLPGVTGLIGELKYQHLLFSGLGLGDYGVAMWSAANAAPSLGEASLAWLVRPVVRVAHARVLDQLHKLIEYTRLQPFERQARALRLPSEEPQPWWWRKLSMFGTAGLARACQSGDEHRALTVVSATAVALRRYRLDRGSYPATLDALVPAYLSRVPVDPYTGRAPAYTLAGAGFALKVTPQPTSNVAALLDWAVAR